MIEAIIATAALLTLPLGMVIWTKIEEARLDREDRLREIEAELKAIKASLPTSNVSEIDNLVAAFAMGAAFATRNVARSGGEDTGSAEPTASMKSRSDGGETVATTAATSAAL